MADTEILQFQLEDGSIAEIEVPREAPIQQEQPSFLEKFGAAAKQEGKQLLGGMLGATSSVSPLGDYTLDILAGALPGVESADLRGFTKQFREEQPYLATGADVIGAFAPQRLYKTLAKGPAVAKQVGEFATKSPIITNLLESFTRGSARPMAEEGKPEPDLVTRALSGGKEAATTAGVMGGTSLVGAAGKRIAQRLLPLMKQAPTTLTPDQQRIVKILGMENVADLTPEKIQEALQSQARAAQAGQGGMETLAESLGTTTQGIAGAYAQGPRGLEIATQALEGRTSPETLRQQMGMITEPLGAPQPYLESQKAGYEALKEMRNRGQAALTERGKEIYKGAFKEEIPFEVVGDYGQKITPQRIGEFPYQVLPPRIKYSEEITRASKDPLYKKLAARVIATTYPKGETAPDIRSLEVADRVASQIKSALKDPGRYAQQTAIDVAEIPANKLLTTIEQELVDRDVTLPARRQAYKEAALKETGLTSEVSDKVSQILSGGPTGEPGKALISSKVDPDSFKMMVSAVKQQTGDEGLEKIKNAVGGAIRRTYSQRQGQRLIDAPFEKGDERFTKIASLVGEEKAVEMVDKVNRLTNFVKFKNKVLGGSQTQPRQEMARQMNEATQTQVAEEVGNFLSMAAGRTQKSTYIRNMAKKYLGSKDKPLSEEQVAKYLFSQGDSAVEKLRATEAFLKDIRRTTAGREWFDSLFNSYLSRELQQTIVTAGLGNYNREK